MLDQVVVSIRASNSGGDTPITSKSKLSTNSKEIPKHPSTNNKENQAEIKDLTIEKANIERNLHLPAHLPDTSARSGSQDSPDYNRAVREVSQFRCSAPECVVVEEAEKLVVEEQKEEAKHEDESADKQPDEDEFKEAEDIIKIENGHKTYLMGIEGVAALRGVSVAIKRKEFVCIFGTSGGGKSTLLNIIGTIDKPTKGSVYIGGMRVKNSTSDRDMAAIRLNKLSFVFQSFNLISTLTALENVELPMQLKGDLSRTQIKQRAEELLDKVGLKERMNHFPRQLSGGEQQRVTIARALANDPEIMLLDEPTGDLDTKNTDVVMKILLDLNSRGMTLVMVSHDLNLKNYANRIIRLSDGKMLGEEIISRQVREKHYKELCDRLQNPEQEKLAVKEGADYLQSKDSNEMGKVLAERFPAQPTSMTALRTEGDYKVVRLAMKHRQTKNLRM